MAAYVIVEILITDPEIYETYKLMAPESVAAHDGNYIVRGGATAILEGDWEPERIVVLEFPTADRAREWWHSEMYSKLKVIRQQSTTTKMILVEGI